jgi:hypothetical protein
MRKLKSIGIIFGYLLLLNIWGLPFLNANESIFVGDINGLEVKLTFFGEKPNHSDGKIIYEKEDSPLIYRVTIKNRSNQSFPQVEMQTSLHVVQASCGDLLPGARLPGNSISPLFTTSLAPGVASNFEHAYNIPGSLCPLTGIVKFRVTYTQRGIIKAANLTCPVKFEIQ